MFSLLFGFKFLLFFMFCKLWRLVVNEFWWFFLFLWWEFIFCFLFCFLLFKIVVLLTYRRHNSKLCVWVFLMDIMENKWLKQWITQFIYSWKFSVAYVLYSDIMTYECTMEFGYLIFLGGLNFSLFFFFFFLYKKRTVKFGI